MAAACILYDQRLKGEVAGRGRRSCESCRGELGRIINRGACCPGCRQRVCKSCRHFGQSTTWLCTLCHKRMGVRTGGDWMKAFSSGNQRSLTETVKRSLQRSWTFSDRSESAWSHLRGSAEMRAYSSLPRHGDCEFLTSAVFQARRGSDPLLNKAISDEHFPQELESEEVTSGEEVTSSEEVNHSNDLSRDSVKKDYYIEKSETDSTIICQKAPSLLEIPVTPECVSDSSEAIRDEPSMIDSLSSAPASSVDSSPAMDKRRISRFTGNVISRVREKRISETSSLPTGVTPPGSRKRLCSEEDPDDYRLVFISSSDSSAEEPQSDTETCLDWDYFESMGPPLGRATSLAPPPRPTSHTSCQQAPVCAGCFVPVPFPVPVPVFVPVPWGHGMTEPVLKLYKSLSSEEPAAAPFPGEQGDSSTSSSESTDDDSPSAERRAFRRTFVVNRSSGDEEEEEEDPTKEALTPDSLRSDTETSSDAEDVPKRVHDRNIINELITKYSKDELLIDKLITESVEIKEESATGVVSPSTAAVTFSNVEVLQIMSEFIKEERKVYDDLEELCKEAAEVRSGLSDEFSGTESMGEDTVESSCGVGETTEMGESESTRYTSLVMITQEGPVCLEEGLADDDSWVEDLERDDLATTTEESEEDEPGNDREEELRGYHRSAIDFTLHTIVEESCEESEVEVEKKPTDLEKYFFFGLGEGEERDDTVSETSSIYSEGGDTNDQSDRAAELASSRLEKYFLSDFMGFSRRDSDGSVGSDSEGKPSPGQRRKRLVRGRGTARLASASMDNLAESDPQPEPSQSEGSDSQDEQSSFVDGQFDTVKRTKKKKRSVSSAPSMELLERCEDSGKEEASDGNKTPQPEFDMESSRTKQQSRDSGFMGSCDDLLKEAKEPPSGETPEESAPQEIKPTLVSAPPLSALSRKDSFNNWSSDEETNLMMSKMRAFFKSMVANHSKSSNVKTGGKPPQLAYFETELTRLMKSVPGIKDEQVREIVEYLSSEDTWSDSYDSSDYTSSDLETGNKKSALQEEISASCRQIISNFEASNDDPVIVPQDSRVYQKLMSSFNKIEPVKEAQNSPPLIEKVMQHIGTRLVALMHEVSSGEGSTPRAHRRLTSKLSTTSEEEEEEEGWGGGALPRSKSHDPLLEEARQEASDNERFSWRGSFESALLADSRTRLAGRRSAGDLVVCEELDRVRSLDSMGGELEPPTHHPPATNSLPRLPTSPASAQIYKAHSVASVKSARYRAPGYRPSSAPPRQRRRPPPPPVGTEENTPEVAFTSKPKEEEEVDRLIQHRASLGSRSDSLASVYSGAGEGRHGGVAVRGEVQFGLQYNYKLSSLEIHVKQCRDLAPVDIKRNRSDPYVKVYLLPDKSKSGKRKTRVRKHTLNPVFEETLRFQVGSLDGLENRTLWLSVWHSDMFGRNDFLGEVLMPLENKVFDDPLPKFYTLQERSEPLEELSSKGELIVGLKFVPPEEGKKRPTKGTLYVLVKEAKNLPAVKSNGTSDPFCKSYLLPDKGRGSKQKAPIVRKTCNPVWNHTLTYNNVSLAELMERSLELTIWDHDRLASNEFLGGVRLSLGTGKHNGKLVDWMDSSGNEITLWQQMSEKPNFWVESCLPLRPSLDTLRKTSNFAAANTL